MRIKRLLTGISAFCFCITLISPVQALAEEQSTKLTVKVPSEHTVQLEIGEHGSVTVEGETYTGTQTIEVDRLKKETYTIQAEKGWKVAEVTYGLKGQAEKAELEDSVFTAPAINQDGNVLTVTVVEGTETPDETPTPTPDATGTPTPGATEKPTGVPGGTGSGGSSAKGTVNTVKTGDETNIGFFIGIMVVSIFITSGCILAARKKKA